MQLTRCPICHSRISLEQLIQDSAGRDLMALVVKLDKPLAMALVSYLGLFRSNKRDLANDKALCLAHEALSLAANQYGQLTVALAQTVEQMRNKAHQGQFKPFKNHNYLKSVLADTDHVLVPEQGLMPQHTGIETASQRAVRRKQLHDSIFDIGNTDW